jgi:hypothetical protein
MQFCKSKKINSCVIEFFFDLQLHLIKFVGNCYSATIMGMRINFWFLLEKLKIIEQGWGGFEGTKDH